MVELYFLNLKYKWGTLCMQVLLTLSSPANIYLLLTISIQNRLFCYESVGIDHTLQVIQYENQILQNCLKLKGNCGHHIGKDSNASFVTFEAERVNRLQPL